MFDRLWNPWRQFVRRKPSRKRRLQPASLATLSVETLELRTLMTANPVVPAVPAEYFVAPGGDDWNTGTVAQPFATIRRALDAAHPGDTITLRNGVYEGGLNVDISNLTIRSMPGEWAVIQSPVSTQWGDGHADSVIRYGFDVNGGKLENLEITGGYWYGVMCWDWWDANWSPGSTHIGASNITIEGCKIHDTGIDAVKITPGANNITLLNNEIYSAGRRTTDSADGIDNNHGDHMLAHGNYVHDIPGTGILTSGGTVGSVIEQNLVKDVGGAGITVGFYSEAEWMDPASNPNYYTSIDTIARNNIVVDPGMAGVGIYSSLNPQVYNNTLINPATVAQAPLQFGGVDIWVSDNAPDLHVESQNPLVENNIITVAAGNHTRLVDIRYQSYTGQLTLDHNLYFSQDLDAPKFINRNLLGDQAPERYLSSWRSVEGFDTHSVTGDPKLDAGFHLTPGSAAIAQGIPLPGLFNDYDGNSLIDPPNPDLGADQFGNGPNLLTPPAAFGAPSLTIAAAAYHETEGGTINVQVVRQGTLADTVTVQFSTLDGSGKAGQDYVAAAGTLTFLPGEKVKTVPVALIQNNTAEGDRHFLFALSNPATSGQLPVRLDFQHTASLTIDDDEVPVTLNYRTLWVANDGSDVTGDGSAEHPWKSLQFAADNVGPGDYVIVKPGQYEGAHITTDGKPDARIVFHAQPGVEINDPDPVQHQDGIDLEGADYVTVEGFYIHDMPRAGIRSVLNTGAEIRDNTLDHNEFWGILTGWSDHLLIENNVTSNSIEQHGIYVSNSSDDGIVRNNLVFGNNDSGIQFNGDGSLPGDGVHSRNLVEGNIIYDNGRHGGAAINLDGFQDGTVQNNLLYDNHSTGIVLYVAYAAQSSTNNLIANNTVVMAGDARWALLMWNSSAGNEVVNNILLSNNPATGSMTVEPDSLPAVSDHNVLENSFQINGVNTNFAAWQQLTGGDDANSLFATPAQLFVNPAAGDYRLQPGSPAVDAGQGVLAPAVDLFGHARPQGAGVDIGALEAGQFTSSLQFDWSDFIAYENGGMAVVSVTRTGDTSQAVTVNYSTSDGTALAGSDYTPAQGTLTFQPGESRQTIDVFVNNDGLNEPIETVHLLLGNPQVAGDPTGMGGSTNVMLGAQATATLHIVSDNVVRPGSFAFDSSVFQVNEAAGTVTITVRRTDGSNGSASVSYATGNWTPPRKPTWEMLNTSILYTVDNDQPATAGTDYTPVQGTLNFADGETVKTFTIPITNDLWYEGNEGLLVTLSNPTGGAQLGSRTAAKVQIVDDDVKQPGTFQFATDAYSVTEGTPAINVVVNRVGGSNVAANVRLYVTGAGNGSTVGSAWSPSDFGSVPDLLTFAPGETSKTISIPIVDDTVTEGTEAFSIQLYSPSNDASVGSPAKTTVSILDNESTLYFSSPDGATFQAVEGSGVMPVKVTRVGSTITSASFKLSTMAWGSATEGADYTPVNQTFTFAPGETSKVISIPIVNDTLMEPKESFGVSMSNVVGAQQGSWTWSAYIIDDDVAANPGTISLSAPTYAVAENGGQLQVQVNRTGGSDGTVSVNYATSDGTTGIGWNQYAYGGGQYGSKSGTLTFAPGETSKLISIPIYDNTSVSVDKLFSIKLSSPNGGATLGAASSAVATIKEDDSAFSFVTSSYTGSEGCGTIQIQVMRQGSTVGQAKVDLKLSGWSATPGQDYIANAVNTLVFQDGETVKTFSLQIIDDVFKEPDEWIGLTLDNAVGAQLGSSIYGSVKITDND